MIRCQALTGKHPASLLGCKQDSFSLHHLSTSPINPPHPLLLQTHPTKGAIWEHLELSRPRVIAEIQGVDSKKERWQHCSMGYPGLLSSMSYNSAFDADKWWLIKETVHNLGNQAGVDHLLYFCANHSRTAIPRNEQRAPEERKKGQNTRIKGCETGEVSRGKGAERRGWTRNRDEEMRESRE